MWNECCENWERFWIEYISSAKLFIKFFISYHKRNREASEKIYVGFLQKHGLCSATMWTPPLESTYWELSIEWSPLWVSLDSSGFRNFLDLAKFAAWGSIFGVEVPSYFQQWVLIRWYQIFSMATMVKGCIMTYIYYYITKCVCTVAKSLVRIWLRWHYI